MKPYSRDLCEKVIQAYRNGEGSLRQIAKRFSVSLNFVWLLWQRYLATGSVEPKPHAGGQAPVMTQERLSALRDLVQEKNDATLKELQDMFRQKTGASASIRTISKALKKLRLPRKKKTFHATERESDPDIIEKRNEYIREMPEMDVQRLVIVDEFGVDLGMVRDHGRAPPGQRAEGHRPCNPGENVTVIAGLTCQGIVAPFMFPGSINAEIFKLYVEKVLVPELKPGSIVVVDNLSSHKAQGAAQALRKAGAEFKFLPPYSPDLSPVERAISKAKGKLREIAARTYESLVDAMRQALDEISPENARAWFKGCGYCIEPR